MILVPDSSALITLAKIGRLELLRQRNETIHIPQGVYEEVVDEQRSRPGDAEVRAAHWIRRSRVKDRAAAHRLMSQIGKGEAVAIVPSRELNADFVILDDSAARAFTETEGRRVLGLLGLLIRAKERGQVPAIKPILDTMQAAGFYIHNALYRKILLRAGEDM